MAGQLRNAPCEVIAAEGGQQLGRLLPPVAGNADLPLQALKLYGWHLPYELREANRQGQLLLPSGSHWRRVD